MKRLCFAFICLAVILATAVSFAYERRVGLGVNGGVAILNGATTDKAGHDERAEMGPMMGFVIRHSISTHLSLGFTTNYGYNYDKDSKSFRTNLLPIDLNLIYNFQREKRTSPYLLASLGMLRWDTNFRPEGKRIEGEREAALGLGAGLDIFLTDIIALDIGGKVRYIVTDESDDLVGRSWDLGITSDDRFLWYASVGLTWYPGKCKDTDGDGVCDNKDKCPDTPPCATVDEFGCPKDSDGDGVWDGCDKCPDTPKCAIVDARGCPKDTDGDGVWDGCDKCPDTPKCATVDANGCPKDTDGDGVWDGCDKCPDTPKGVQVKEDGCPKKCDLSPLEGISFRFDKSDIIPSPSPILDMAVEIIKGCPMSKIEIQGHTDWMGSDDYNMKLGQRRADIVRKYLVDHGIEADRLFTKSYGESKPIATNDTREGRAKNRRIVFVEID